MDTEMKSCGNFSVPAKPPLATDSVIWWTLIGPAVCRGSNCSQLVPREFPPPRLSLSLSFSLCLVRTYTKNTKRQARIVWRGRITCRLRFKFTRPWCHLSFKRAGTKGANYPFDDSILILDNLARVVKRRAILDPRDTFRYQRLSLRDRSSDGRFVGQTLGATNNVGSKRLSDCVADDIIGRHGNARARFRWRCRRYPRSLPSSLSSSPRQRCSLP